MKAFHRLAVLAIPFVREQEAWNDLAKARTEHIGLTPCNAEAAARPKIIEAKVEQFRSVHRSCDCEDMRGCLSSCKLCNRLEATDQMRSWRP